MAQHDGQIDDQYGASFLVDLNALSTALLTNHSGPTAPAPSYAYQWWADTSTGLLKQRNGANDGWLVRGPLADWGIQTGAQIVASASGTADALTASFTPAITTLSAGLTLRVRAALANASATPTFTPNVATIAAKQIVKGAGSALAAGDIAGAGHWLTLQYDATLDKWVLGNPAQGVVSSTSIQGAYKNLAALASGTSASVSVSADEIALENASSNYITLRSVSLTIAGTSVGANGLDTGALATSSWYSIWVIFSPTTQTTAGLMSLSATAPTLPSGYTYKARVGWIRTDGTANKYPLSFVQSGRRVQYKVATGSNLTALPAMASGVQGAPAVPTWAAVAAGNFVPSTASSIDLTIHVISLGKSVMAAPSAAYGTYASATTPPPLCLTVSVAAAQNMNASKLILLESSSVYYASDDASGSLVCCGWEDSI